jgi:hypothetical protein
VVDFAFVTVTAVNDGCKRVPPAAKRNDARYVAIATVASLEIVVSWNHRHLANERKRALFNEVNRRAGYEQELLIHTPFEVMQ